MTDQMKEARERIAAGEEQAAARWRKLAKVDPEASASFAAYERAASMLKGSAATTRSTVERLRKDDTLYPEGKARLIREALDKGRSERETYLRQMAANLEVMKAHLALAATPAVDPKREALARQEATMILDNSPDPVGAMMQIAQRGGEAATVVAGSWGQSYLLARGTDKVDEVHASVQTVARSAATKSDDPQLRQAAEVFQAIDGEGGLDDVYVPAIHLARWEFEAAETGEASE